MPTIAYSSPFVPAEWIASHGFEPRRLRGPNAPIDGPIDSRVGLCPYMRSFINEAGTLCDLAGIVFTTTCDQMRRAADIVDNLPCFTMNVPATWQNASSQELYIAELKRLGVFLETAGAKRPTETELVRTMLKYDEQRKTLRAARGWNDSVSSDQTRLALVGGPISGHDAVLFKTIERYGGRIELDGSETGERTLAAPFNRRRLRDNPLLELADAYFGTIPDAFRRPNSELYRWLATEIGQRSIEGVILIRYLWCDLWHAEAGRIREWLDVPMLDLELNAEDPVARLETKVQAFLEALR